MIVALNAEQSNFNTDTNKSAAMNRLAAMINPSTSPFSGDRHTGSPIQTAGCIAGVRIE